MKYNEEINLSVVLLSWLFRIQIRVDFGLLNRSTFFPIQTTFFFCISNFLKRVIDTLFVGNCRWIELTDSEWQNGVHIE